MSEFHPIDMQTWPMAQAFHYYTRIAPTSYTINVNMDVTILRRELKKKREDISFFRPIFI